MKQRYSMILLTFALCLLFPRTALQESMPNRLTLMVYMCGSNLESEYASASADLQEMLDVNFDVEQVKVIVMCGGSLSWASGYDPEAANVLEIGRPPMAKANGFRTVPWADEAMNMGEPGTLSWFVDNCVERYPAKDYALILWDHGGGPLEGVCWDERYYPDRLSMEELTQALEAAKLPKKLSWIGFDACLMSTLEVASKLSPYAEYMIASQEREPASGWDYAFLNGIEADADGATTGRRVVDSYLETASAGPAELTMACVDLSATAEVEERLGEMFGRLSLQLNGKTFSKISKLRFPATSFGKALETVESSSGYDLVDMVSLSECFEAEDAEGVRRVRDAVERAVTYHGENIEHCCGISVYHPYRNQKQFTTKWEAAYSGLDFCKGYSAYVKAYGEIMTSEHLVLWNDLNDIQALDSPETSENGALVTLKLSTAQAQSLASARLVVLARNVNDEADDAFFRVFNSSRVNIEGNLLSSVYDGSAMQILNASGTEPLTGAVSYRVTEDGNYLLKLYPTERDGSRWKRPIIAEYKMDAEGRLALKGYSVYDAMTETYTSRADVDLSAFAGLCFLNDYRNPTENSVGEVLDFEQWTGDSHTREQLKSRYDIDRTAFMPSFAMDLSLAEDMYAAFEITDTQGNTYMSRMVALTGKSSIQYYGAESFLGDDVPDVQASLFTYWEDREIDLVLFVGNASQAEQSYGIEDLRLNGRPVDRGADDLFFIAGESLWASPGKYIPVVIPLDAQLFEKGEAGGSLLEISGTLIAFRKGGSQRNYITFSTKPGISLDAIFHEEGAAMSAVEDIEDLPVSLIASDEDGTTIETRVFLRPAENAVNARVLINVVLTNGGDRDLFFMVENVKANGLPVDAYNVAMEDGSRRTDEMAVIAPGERRAVNIFLTHRDIARFMPDVSLNEVSYQMAVAEMEDGKVRELNVLPIEAEMNVALDCFAEDSDRLPPRALVEAGSQIGGIGEDTAKVLFSDEGCEVSLQGLYVVDSEVVLLLGFDNQSDVPRQIELGHCLLDGRRAVIGQTVNKTVQIRNNRVRSYFLNKNPWRVEKGISLTLQAKASARRYVSVQPAKSDRAQVRRLSFRACIYGIGQELEYRCFDGCEIDLGEAVSLEPGMMAVGAEEDISVIPGMSMTQPEFSPLFMDEMLADGNALSGRDITLRVEPQNGERIAKGYYILLRRVSSDAELANMNIDNSIVESDGQPEISFANGRQWLIFEAVGQMDVADDGSSATALYPCARPVIRGEGESLPLLVSSIARNEDGTVAFTEIQNAFYFLPTEFPGMAATSAVGGVTVVWHPATGEAELTGFKSYGKDVIDVMRGLVFQDVLMIPEDADEASLISLIADEADNKAMQAQLLSDARLQLAIEGIDDPENYCVAFYYKNMEDVVRCTTPRPLADFKIPHN